MPPSKTTDDQRAFDRRVTQAAIRLSLLALLAFWCLRILAPFLNPIIGGAVIAIAVQTPYAKLTGALGGRPKLAAVLMVLVALLVLIVPTLALGASLVDSTAGFSDDLIHDQIKIPAPPDSVAGWPIVGERLHGLWLGASENLESVLVKLAPYMKDVGLWLVSSVGDLGMGVALFIVAILIAGALLPNGERATRLADKVAYLLAGPRGPKLADLAASSVQSVTRGVLGVAVLQSLLAGLGMLVVGVPAAGLWTLLILILAVMQLPPTLVLIPVIIYVFYTSSTVVAVLFAIWSILVGLSDNVLKPLLMGRGSAVPMLVLFMGSIGGFIAGGILGLFVGAVVLSLGYTIFMAWVDESDVDGGNAATAATEVR
ncbi:MAG: AI-2E family transporter [Polyangiales bacterium]